MSNMTDYLADKVRDHVLRNTAYTTPGTVYLALFTSATTKAGGGTEVVGGSYERQVITFSGPSTGLAQQSGVVTFSGMPACTVTHLAVMDASSAGNMLLHGKLRTARSAVAGQSLPFGSADIRFLFA